MTQLVLGTALGFMVAQAVLYTLKRLMDWLQQGNIGYRIRGLAPSRPSPAFLGGFIKYASLLGGSAALITFGVWSVEDYLAAKAARTAATLKVPDLSTVAPEPQPKAPPEEVAAVATAPEVEPAAVPAPDPYADPDFKIQRRVRRGGAPLSLKETLVERSEAKARDDLLKQTRQNTQRSQYDCEAADRASKYVRSGLDVWGFARWQVKYFPMEAFKGSMLAQCQDIKNLVDPSTPRMQSAVAQQNHP